MIVHDNFPMLYSNYRSVCKEMAHEMQVLVDYSDDIFPVISWHEKGQTQLKEESLAANAQT